MTETPDPLGRPETPPFAPPATTAGPQPGGPSPYAYPPGAPGVGSYPPPGPYPGMYPPPPMPYGEYPGGFAPPRNGLGVTALVVAIVALLAAFTVFGGIGLGIVAVILGVLGRARVKKGEANNGGVATAGIVIGAVAVALSIALFSFGIWMFHKVGGNSYLDCIRDAGQDQAKVQECSDEFRQSVENRFGTTAPTR